MDTAPLNKTVLGELVIAHGHVTFFGISELWQFLKWNELGHVIHISGAIFNKRAHFRNLPSRNSSYCPVAEITLIIDPGRINIRAINHCRIGLDCLLILTEHDPSQSLEGSGIFEVDGGRYCQSVIDSVFIGDRKPIFVMNVEEKMLDDWPTMGMVVILDVVFLPSHFEGFLSDFKGMPLIFKKIF